MLQFAFRHAQAPSRRFIATSPALRKSATETAQETLEAANRKSGDIGVKGIDKAQEAAQATKEAVGLGAKEAQGKAAEVSGKAQGAASEMGGEAKGKAAELKGKAKGTAEEVKSKM